MKYSSLFVIFFYLLSTSVQAQGIQFFDGTWKEALAKAKAEDKILFVDAFAKWCGPCKMMAKNVFTQEKVGDYFNKNFINLKLDMEEADGITFGHKHPVRAYPTLFFLDGDGNIVTTVRGSRNADDLLNLGKDALSKLDLSPKFEEQYLAGDRDYDLVYSYVRALNAAGKPSLKISNEYLNSNPDINEDQHLAFILEAANEADSKIFDEVLANSSKIKKLVGEEEFILKTKTACKNTVTKAIEFEMESLLKEAQNKATKAFPSEAKEFNAESEMRYYKTIFNEDKYINAYRSLAKIYKREPAMMRPIITDILKNFKDNPKMTADALDYATKLYKENEDIESLNLYCSALIINNQTDKAISVVTKAKERAAKQNKETGTYDGILRFLNSKKS